MWWRNWPRERPGLLPKPVRRLRPRLSARRARIDAMSKVKASFIFALCSVFLGGCAVGPNYKRPGVVSPAVFRGDNAPTNSSFADLDWWEIYRDAGLQALVREAFTNNYELRMAVARVEQAPALAPQEPCP